MGIHVKDMIGLRVGGQNYDFMVSYIIILKIIKVRVSLLEDKQRVSFGV